MLRTFATYLVMKCVLTCGYLNTNNAALDTHMRNFSIYPNR